jgi:hypothetical protein
MTVSEMLSRMDSQELSEWYAYDQRWPLDDGWQQTARICRIIMASSGNYGNKVPEESAFIPATRRVEQTQDQIIAELMKLTKKPGDDINASV